MITIKQRDSLFREVLLVAAGECACTALMLGVFAITGHFNLRVFLGALLGSAASVLNYALMAVSVAMAADKAAGQDVRGGTRLMRTSMLLRNGLLLLILALALKSGHFHALALILPVFFIRPILAFVEFFRKKGEKKA